MQEVSLCRRWSRIPGQTLLLLSLLSLTAGCHSERNELQAQLSAVNSQEETVRQTLSNQQSAVEAMSQRLRAQNAELQEYIAQVEGYILDHRMAVAAIAAGIGGSVPVLSSDNSYSAEVKEIGAVMMVLAVVWAADHLDEISDVVKNLNYADAHKRTLQAGIEQTTDAIRQQQAEIQVSQQRLADLDQKVAALQTRLSQL